MATSRYASRIRELAPGANGKLRAQGQHESVRSRCASCDAPKKDAPPADAQNAPPPADSGPQPRATYCYSDDKKPTIYFSDAFDTAELPNPKAWANAFTKLLADKYMYKGIVTCKNSDTIFNVQNAIRDQKDTLTGKQLTDTEWTYEPPAPGEAPPPDETPAPPPPPKKKTTTAKPTTAKPQNP